MKRGINTPSFLFLDGFRRAGYNREKEASALDELEDDLFCLRLLEEARNDPREEFEDFDIFAERIKASWA